MKLISWLVRERGALVGTVFVTLVSAVLSALATAAIMWLLSGEVGRTGLLYGVIVPLIIAPPFSFMTLRLVEQLHQAQAELRRLSATDPMTGVANRRVFMEFAAHEMARSRRYGVGLGVVMLDVDNLKETNDRCGHPAGDALLCAVASTCVELCRESDTFARIGGDEFGYVVGNATAGGLEAFAHRLVDAIRAIATPYEDLVLRTSVSVGTALCLPTDDDLSQILWRADEAMYAVKHAGGDAVQHG